MTLLQLKEHTQKQVHTLSKPSRAHRELANFYNLLNVINICLLFLLLFLGLRVSCCGTILVHALY